MNGLLIYNKADYKKNSDYVKWIQDMAAQFGMKIELVFSDDFYQHGYEKYDQIQFAINRTRDYHLSLILELNHVRVFNQSTITLLGNNKLAAYRHAKEQNIKYPPVRLDWTNQDQIISKPVDGHGGEGVQRLSELKVSDFKNRIQQTLLTNLMGDIRFYVINNQIIQAIIRKNDGGLLFNYSQNNTCEIFEYTHEHHQLVHQFLHGLKADYVGVDFFLTDEGELIFNELEDVVGSRMLSDLGINNTTELFLTHIMNQLKGA
ncbi:ATP-grasp domain-containing protein [Piscibacillus halophilus]|uniref:Glutathione synthase/RimK-type ligase, ATP-grasp superfamily n=1 Tax=Piscibacillus halophilus TaxID=571933 RepID=A0A1H9D0L0_9BACI|nr:ATP-grasp domain-containing protein [Piscibacillus halophilus]SEQ06995.1 Glutathione synthase/RimK-type ligase, ATP-grasp superfamily [Piscibacillus halophilus]